MTLRNPNPTPRFSTALAQLPGRPAGTFVVVDIGARGGAEKCWQVLTGQLRLIGFDASAAECEHLNRAAKQGGHEYHARIIGGRTGRATFYTTKFAHSCGLYQGNPDYIGRFPFTNMDVIASHEVDTTTLDTFAKEIGLDQTDFIKIDVEGAEMDVLEGAIESLRDRKVLGIKTEFWWDPVSKGQRSFAEIDIFLREQGFRFFDLELHNYHVYFRNALPAGRLVADLDPVKRRADNVRMAPYRYGQAVTGDALYFRDPVHEFKTQAPTIQWDESAILRLCALYDIFDYGDCAIELLEYCRDRLLPSISVDDLIDAAVPTVSGMIVSYDNYREVSIQLRKAINKSNFNSTDWEPAMTRYRCNG